MTNLANEVNCSHCLMMLWSRYCIICEADSNFDRSIPQRENNFSNPNSKNPQTQTEEPLEKRMVNSPFGTTHTVSGDTQGSVKDRLTPNLFVNQWFVSNSCSVFIWAWGLYYPWTKV